MNAAARFQIVTLRNGKYGVSDNALSNFPGCVWLCASGMTLEQANTEKFQREERDRLFGHLRAVASATWED